MKRVLATAAVLAAANLSPAAGQDFYAHWGDGRAELSSYRIDQPRYGESREAYGVMIFVTEDLNAGTGIKVESQVPAADRVYVLKLNNVLKFTTGIYDYSVMTSVFSAVEPGVGTEPFELRKVNLTSQEWCGHVFEEVRVAADSLRGDLNSYFERDGRQRWNMETPAAFESEDNLLIRIRELNGEWMKTEEARQLRLLPGLWKIRSGEAPRKLVHATLTKGAVEEIETGGVRRAAVRWTWGYGRGQTVVWVEQAAPRRILAWRDSGGSSGELLNTLRVPYWELQANSDETYRRQLGIPEQSPGSAAPAPIAP